MFKMCKKEQGVVKGFRLSQNTPPQVVHKDKPKAGPVETSTEKDVKKLKKTKSKYRNINLNVKPSLMKTQNLKY